MTTDHDLLARIDLQIKYFDIHPIVSEGGSAELEATFERMFIPTTLEVWRNQLSAWKALRAVVELHKPEHSIRGYRCTSDDAVHPCPTIQAIEKELG